MELEVGHGQDKDWGVPSSRNPGVRVSVPVLKHLDSPPPRPERHQQNFLHGKNRKLAPKAPSGGPLDPVFTFV